VNVPKGLLVVISGPSGGGKTTLWRLMVERYPDVVFSVSATTRPPRAGEVDGRDYFFYTKSRFQEEVANNTFLEWACVYGNYYGTIASYVDNLLAAGKNVLLDIDTQGARQIKTKRPEGIFVYVVPPSYEELVTRITKRGSEDPEAVARRLQAVPDELKELGNYDYLIINDDPEKAQQQLRCIMLAEALRVKRQDTSWLENFAREAKKA